MWLSRVRAIFAGAPCPPSALCLPCLPASSVQGLHYLHSQGKVHRDIKPGNLLINSRNFVKIADFGLAASLEGLSSQTVGTNRYLPPEMLDSPDDGEGYA